MSEQQQVALDTCFEQPLGMFFVDGLLFVLERVEKRKVGLFLVRPTGRIVSLGAYRGTEE